MMSTRSPCAADGAPNEPQVTATDKGWQIRLSSSPYSVRAALKEIETKLLDGAAPCDLCERVEMVMAEVLNNVVEHAYENQAGGVIDVLFCYQNNLFRAEITDQGQPMPNCAVPIARLPALSASRSDLPEGGFGWLMIHSITSNLEYVRSGAENRTCLEIPI